jgi:hypothetical protein
MKTGTVHSYAMNDPGKKQRRHLTSVFLIIFTHFMTMGISVNNPYTDYNTEIYKLQYFTVKIS